MDQILISKPDTCHLWISELTKDLLLKSLGHLKNYRNDYHNSRDLKKCNTCGQLYFSEFHEEIDFRSGDDQEYYTFIPVNDTETAEKLNKLSRLELTSFLGIVMNFPSYNSTPYWNNR